MLINKVPELQAKDTFRYISVYRGPELKNRSKGKDGGSILARNIGEFLSHYTRVVSQKTIVFMLKTVKT
jgi:hypothetical protein